MDHIEIVKREFGGARFNGGCTCMECSALRKTIDDAEKWAAIEWAGDIDERTITYYLSLYREGKEKT